MAIITNEDIKVMVDVEELLHKKLVQTNAIKDSEYLEGYHFDENDEEYNLWCKYWTMIERFIKTKKDLASKQNKWNKANKEYHRITNNISTNKKSGNKEKEQYWRNELKKFKELNR